MFSFVSNCFIELSSELGWPILDRGQNNFGFWSFKFLVWRLVSFRCIPVYLTLQNQCKDTQYKMNCICEKNIPKNAIICVNECHKQLMNMSSIWRVIIAYEYLSPLIFCIVCIQGNREKLVNLSNIRRPHIQEHCIKRRRLIYKRRLSTVDLFGKGYWLNKQKNRLKP